MAMARLQLYQNKYRYPEYLPTDQLRPHGNEIDVTPKNISSTGGTLHLAGNHSTFHSCNYLRYTRNGVDVYAWITDFTQRTDKSYDVTYEVDAFRTYYHDIDWGTQYIKRRPEETNLKDDMLGSSTPYPEVTSKLIDNANMDNRILVVQTRAMSGEISSNTPVQPLPYRFYFVDYPINDWQSVDAIKTLVTTLSEGAETQNIVTMYSIPWTPTTSLSEATLHVQTASGTTDIPGFKMMSSNALRYESFYNMYNLDWDFTPSEITRVEHSVQILVTDAGIIDVPAELFSSSSVKLRQDIDIYSGACNYMLVSGERGTGNVLDDYTTTKDTIVDPATGELISSLGYETTPLLTYDMNGDYRFASGSGYVGYYNMGEFIGRELIGWNGSFPRKREATHIRVSFETRRLPALQILADTEYKVYPNSVRGSAVSSLPVVSDPLDTYLSQNQNALATSLIGDVASIAGGAAMAVGTAGVGAMAGGALALNGVNGMVTRQGNIADATSSYSNPPAFLGTALVNNFNQRFYMITKKMTPSNASIVNSNFGYPFEMIWPLSIPSEGFIQTEGCNVSSKQGWTPRWALDAINTIMNNGLYVHDSW